jgi:hypothetical protein
MAMTRAKASQITTKLGSTGTVRGLDDKLREFVSVKDFGADNTGATNCYAAVESAWTYCLANGKDLYFPSGTYSVKSENNFPFGRIDGLPPVSLLDCKNITIFGDGPTTILRTDTVGGADVLQFNGAKNLHVRNLKLMATVSGSAAGSNGISVTGGFDNITIDEVWCDPASDQTESTMSLDTITMLQQIKGRTKNGPAISYITGPYRSLSYGVDKVRTLFGDGDKQPTRLKFARSLIAQEATMAKGRTPRGILRDVMAYQYPEMKDGRSVSDDPLKDGVHDHANDALRYFGVGMWLTSPLRQLDYDLQRSTAQGFRRAA